MVWQVYGQASDIVLEVEQTMGDNERFLIELAKTTGRPLKDVRHWDLDFTLKGMIAFN